ncbi:hypothetical protein C3941_01980 [Kaistia algarum]|uniref:hypothetical protein n=1 Tax=Kaistia algarum TaxID=2083279 RepID=UPI000CE8A072|nr:hypothetical protein [Kaistia algarum]MCX5513012.1 hypothetical protein [Kaistia algarum]PPE81505.1 hypothetical protein C3941_01980 [Kaistia algarum]
MEIEEKRKLQRLYAARAKIAWLVIEDRVYAPIFEALEQDIAELEVANDPIERARLIARSQRAKA